MFSLYALLQASLGIDLSRQNSPVGGLRQPLVTDLAVGVGITSPADANRSVDETQSIPNVSGVLSKAGTSEEEIRTLKSKVTIASCPACPSSLTNVFVNVFMVGTSLHWSSSVGFKRRPSLPIGHFPVPAECL